MLNASTQRVLCPSCSSLPDVPLPLVCALLLMASATHFPLSIPLSWPLLLLMPSTNSFPAHYTCPVRFSPSVCSCLCPFLVCTFPLAIPIRIRTLPYSATAMLRPLSLPPNVHSCSIRSLAAVFIIGKLLKRAQISSSGARRDVVQFKVYTPCGPCWSREGVYVAYA